MRGKRFFIGSIAILAIFAVTLFVTSTYAAAQEQEEVLYSFGGGTDGLQPGAGLIWDAAGNLYGTTPSGGPYGGGIVFELTPAAGGGWTEKVLHNFNPFSSTDGAEPSAGLIFDAAGNLYGTTTYGGTYNNGTVFELTRSPHAVGGGWTLKLLHSFGNGTDGVNPTAGLIFDGAGNLYSTTAAGGAYNWGTVFELTPAAGGTWTEKVLHNFNYNGTDGDNPRASLIIDAAGNLYGTTFWGGTDDIGTVFELVPMPGGSWTERVLHSFTYSGTDGAYPYAGLIFDAAGNLYGTTSEGGISPGSTGAGAVFELTRSPHAVGGGWTEKVLYSFLHDTDGCYPSAGLIFDAAGNLYGTTPGCGGPYNLGTVFELTPQGGGGWTMQWVYAFTTGGACPEAGLIFDAAGNLYGTTVEGGTYNMGTVFEIPY